MAGRAADLLDVGGAEAALGGGEPGGGRGLATEVEGLERLHPGGRQQDAGIVGGRDQRSRGYAQVPALLEEGQIGLPDQLRIHGGEGYATGARCPRPPPPQGAAAVSGLGDRSVADDEIAVAEDRGLAGRAGASRGVELEGEAFVPAGDDPLPASTRQASGRER